jgi:hypothetical protein
VIFVVCVCVCVCVCVFFVCERVYLYVWSSCGSLVSCSDSRDYVVLMMYHTLSLCSFSRFQEKLPKSGVSHRTVRATLKPLPSPASTLILHSVRRPRLRSSSHLLPRKMTCTWSPASQWWWWQLLIEFFDGIIYVPLVSPGFSPSLFHSSLYYLDSRLSLFRLLLLLLLLRSFFPLVIYFGLAVRFSLSPLFSSSQYGENASAWTSTVGSTLSTNRR